MDQTPGRRRDAATTRVAILDAAEVAFAEHGFEGARIDAIASASGYNKSLIFQYFSDKLGLYAEVLRRAEHEAAQLQSRIVAPLFMDPSLANDGPRLRAFFTAAFDAMFAYLLEHQRLTRILFWEMASGWKTYVQLGSRLQSADLAPLEALFQRAHASGLIRSSFAPAVQLTIALQICHVYLASAPLYRMQQPLLEPRATEARRYLVELVVASIMSDAPAGAALPNC